MNVIIEGLNLKVGQRMMVDTANRIFKEESNSREGVIDVTLNENAIIKVYCGEIYFELGGWVTNLRREDFFTITIE